MRFTVLFPVLTVAVCGCTGGADSEATREPSPRPVSVLTLRETDPTRSMNVAGTVGSWKTEEIGFEVSGRLKYTIEPETNVSGSSGELESQPLASIDPERYDTAVSSAEARIVMLERQKAAAIIQRDQVLPAQRDSAVATRVLAQGDYDRTKALFDEKAVAKAELDKFDANLKTANAMVVQLDASKEAQTAEIASLDAQIDQAAAALKDAKRDRTDCTLRAPFRGQIAKVHVIPGGTVQRGEPVLTLQMMDPMKVEFEVSAERARQLHYKDGLTLRLPLPDGKSLEEEGIIYRTDAVADPSTRTFTITVLIRNRLVPVTVPDDVDVKTLAKTRDIWSLVRGILDDSARDFIEENSIHKDGEGEYVWKVIEDIQAGGRTRGPLLQVEKARVKSGAIKTSFLGLWTFRDITVDDPATLVAGRDRILGRLDYRQESQNSPAVRSCLNANSGSCGLVTSSESISAKNRCRAVSMFRSMRSRNPAERTSFSLWQRAIREAPFGRLKSRLPTDRTLTSESKPRAIRHFRRANRSCWAESTI